LCWPKTSEFIFYVLKWLTFFNIDFCEDNLIQFYNFVAWHWYFWSLDELLEFWFQDESTFVEISIFQDFPLINKVTLWCSKNILKMVRFCVIFTGLWEVPPIDINNVWNSEKFMLKYFWNCLYMVTKSGWGDLNVKK